jgi:pyruvate formate lyase activating enzyme
LVWYATKCIGDRACIEACPEDALTLTEEGMDINRERCTSCGDCEEACPTAAMTIMGKEWEIDSLLEELAKDKVFFETSSGGITLSGGEPTFQLEFIIKLAEGLQEMGIHVAIDTCGYASKDTMRRIIDKVDMVLYDLKVMDSAKHKEYTGVPLERVLENAKIVGKSDVEVWVRTPVIPDYTDSEDNVRAIAHFIDEFMPNVTRYDLLAFNRMCIDKYALFGLEYPLKDKDLVQKETMEKLQSVARLEGIENVVWSGMTRREDGSIENETPEQTTPCD